MTRLNPPRASERISRVLLQSAVLVAVVFWVSDRGNGSSMEELEEAKAVHAEMHTLRAERDLLRADVWALRDQLGQTQRERELARDQIERLRVDVTAELVAIAPSSSSTKLDSEAVSRPVPRLPVPNVVEKEVVVSDPKAPPTTDSMWIPAALAQSPIVEEPEAATEVIDLVSVAPSLGDFYSGKRGAQKLSLADETELKTVELRDYQPAFDRSRAESMWLEALDEASDTECRRQRGLSRSRCESEITQRLEPYSALAIQCIMSGNARPDYVQGVATKAVPSHGVALEHGAIILCDAELANR